MSTEKAVSEESFQFADTPAAPAQAPESKESGVRTTSYPAIKNAPLPADGPGSDTFNNYLLFTLLALIPGYFAWKLNGGLITWLFFA
ncbi:hypothetical protein KC331_g19031, partial [Hortaea werneckii]